VKIENNLFIHLVYNTSINAIPPRPPVAHAHNVVWPTWPINCDATLVLDACKLTSFGGKVQAVLDSDFSRSRTMTPETNQFMGRWVTIDAEQIEKTSVRCSAQSAIPELECHAVSHSNVSKRSAVSQICSKYAMITRWNRFCNRSSDYTSLKISFYSFLPTVLTIVHNATVLHPSVACRLSVMYVLWLNGTSYSKRYYW